jgi:hypothetical protein
LSYFDGDNDYLICNNKKHNMIIFIMKQQNGTQIYSDNMLFMMVGFVDIIYSVDCRGVYVSLDCSLLRCVIVLF